MKANQLSFGIEIECFAPNAARQTLPAGQYHNGLQINLPHTAGWNGQRDASLMAPVGHCPIEIVSPVLSAEDGLIGVWYVTELLQQLGAGTNGTCGLHVHVSKGVGKPYTQDEVSRILSAYRKHQPALWALNGSSIVSRLSSPYCRPGYGESHGVSLNTHNLNNRKGTIEFRMFAGNLSPEYIITAVYACVGFVAMAIADTDFMVSGHTFTHAAEALSMMLGNADFRIIPDEDPFDLVEYWLSAAMAADIADRDAAAAAYRRTALCNQVY